MASFISDRELRKLERDRRREELEEERERLTREIEESEQKERMNMDDYRRELSRIRQERREIQEQHGLDRQRFEEQRQRSEEIDRRKAEEKRKLEIERREADERMRLQIERHKYKERRRLQEEEEAMKRERKIYEFERKELEEARQRKLAEEKRINDEIERYREKSRVHMALPTYRYIEGGDAFENVDLKHEKRGITLRRQSESALDKLRKTNDALEAEVKQLNKTWEPDSGIKKELLDNIEEQDKEWRVIDNYENTGYETDDEVDKLEDNIEKLKLREQALLKEVTYKRSIKREREQQRKEHESQKKRLEKRKMLLQLIEEQQKMLLKLKKHEDTLNALDSADNESDLETPFSKEDSCLPEYTLARKNHDSEQTTDVHKYMIPKVPHLTEENFEEWKTEVEVMIDSKLYQKEALLLAVRNTLSKASKRLRSVLPTIDPKATTAEILDKLETVFGDRRSGESHLAEFYKAKQTKDENVAEWGVRLETILLKAEKKGQISSNQKEHMLMRRFWKYLYDDTLKLSTRMFYERCASFEELLRVVRVEEREMNSDSSDRETKRSEQTVGRLLKRIDKLEETIRKAENRDNRDHYQEIYDENGWNGRFQRGRARYRGQYGSGFGRGDRGRGYRYDSYDRRNYRDFDRNWRYRDNQKSGYEGREEDWTIKDEHESRKKDNDQTGDQAFGKGYPQDRLKDTSDRQGGTHESREYSKGRNKEGNEEQRKSDRRYDNRGNQSQRSGYNRRGYDQSRQRGGGHQPNF